MSLTQAGLNILFGESVNDETKASMAIFKLLSVTQLINQYRMKRPFGGCNPEFGVNHVYLCVPLLL